MKHLETPRGSIEYRWVHGTDADAPTLVFLHEGLGSVALWRDFPARLAHAAGCRALVYSRRGYGGSEPVEGPRGVDFMHVEAQEVLPDLLRALGVDRPVLFGHSDGASIALIHAARAAVPPRAVVALAPHVMVEPITVDSIAVAREAFARGRLRERLARYHDDVDGAFGGWCDIWLAPEFRDWSIVPLLSDIRCPVLAIQGDADEYGTLAQVDTIASLARDARVLKLPGVGHSPHRDAPEAVIAASVDFLAALRRHTAGGPGTPA